MMSRVMGSAFIVAGTTIGAGMLAMPLSSARLGFGATALGLLLMWGLSYYAALLFAEVYRHHPARLGLARVAQHYLGPWGRWATSLVLLLFMYAVVAAYITGGGALATAFLGLPSVTAMLAYTALVAVVVLIGTALVDRLTQILFAVKLLTFGFILLLTLPTMQPAYLLSSPQGWTLPLAALPVFATAFGFHAVIPAVAEYLGGKQRALRAALLWGTLLPLSAYLLWQLAIHGAVPQAQLETVGNLEELSRTLSGGRGGLELGVQVFSGLALTSSFLGIGLALVGSLRDVLSGVLAASPALLRHHKAPLGLLAFAPPLLLAALYPQGFLLLLGYAGMLSLLYTVVLPVAMVWKAREQHPEATLGRAPGGKPALLLALATALLIMAVPFLVSAGLLAGVG